MVSFRQWLLIAFALVLGCGPALADSAKERRIFAASAGAFNNGLWNQAETGFTQFLKDYPDSTNAPEAGLLLARSQFEQNNFTNAIGTLKLRLPTSRNFADQYVYWIGESLFEQGELQASAETFDSLAVNFSGSTLRLQALVESAAARAQLAEWPAVEQSLETNSVFQQALQTDPDSELVLRGQLLRAQAKFEQRNYPGAVVILDSKNVQALPPKLNWPWAFLFCRARLATDDLNGALAGTTNLFAIAAMARNDGWTAATVALHAGLLERLGQTNAAIQAYADNLKAGTPSEQQQQAILKIAGLSLAQDKYPAVETNLENFVAAFPAAPGADVALLTLGELRLKDYLAMPLATNLLSSARAAFSQFLNVYTNSTEIGRAYLGLGWCDSFAGATADAQNDFAAAAQRLPVSEDLAVARFKLADMQFAQNDFHGALTNYQSILADFGGYPRVDAALGAQALYQILRANLALNDVAAAGRTLDQIETFYPANEMNVGGALLLGESLTAAGQPAGARKQLQQIEAQFPHSTLRPEIQLAIARTYEQERDWPAAIADYTAWQKDFPTHSLRPQVDYLLAVANYQAGNETNALTLFGGFLTRFPTNSLAPQAQWWVADHFYRSGDFIVAETNYEAIYQNTNWQSSTLFYPAQLMAGVVAMARQGFPDARQYFVNLFSDSNCPPDIAVKARFACGQALMQIPSPDTNFPFANIQAATNIFGQVVAMYPTNDIGARGWGEIADCALQMNDLAGATNAYAQVIRSPAADIAVRSGAQVGYGMVLEKMAAQATDADRTNLLQQALGLYWNVLSAANVHDGGNQDAFWAKKAGLQGAPLVGMLYDVKRQKNFYQMLERLLPQLRETVDKKIAALPPDKS